MTDMSLKIEFDPKSSKTKFRIRILNFFDQRLGNSVLK